MSLLEIVNPRSFDVEQTYGDGAKYDPPPRHQARHAIAAAPTLQGGIHIPAVQTSRRTSNQRRGHASVVLYPFKLARPDPIS